MACRGTFLRSLVLVAAAFPTLPLFAQEWTRFRGPNGSGQSEAANIPIQWTADDYNWTVTLPGVGHSSPVLWGDKLFILSADPQTAEQYFLCLRTGDGGEAWRQEFASAPHPVHPRNSFASSSPAVDSQRVYVVWSTPQAVTVAALDHGGCPVWQRDLGPFVGRHGWGVSPVVYNDLLFVANMQQGAKLKAGQAAGRSSVVALDCASGDVRWTLDRRSVSVSYASPCILENADGTAELICCSTGHGISSIDIATGREKWNLEVFDKRVVSSPILVSGLVLGTTGSGSGGNYLAVVRPGSAPELVYRIDRQAPYVPIPVAYGELVFLWSDRGIVTCIEASSGNVVWSERIGGNFFGSPVRVRDRLYCIDEDGVVVVLAASRQFQELARNPLGEVSRSTPTVSGERMYLRTYSRLFSIGGRASK